MIYSVDLNIYSRHEKRGTALLRRASNSRISRRKTRPRKSGRKMYSYVIYFKGSILSSFPVFKQRSLRGRESAKRPLSLPYMCQYRNYCASANSTALSSYLFILFYFICERGVRVCVFRIMFSSAVEIFDFFLCAT